MRHGKIIAATALAIAVFAAAAPPASSYEPRRYYGRFSFFAQAAQRDLTGAGNDTFSELIGTFTLRSAANDKGGFEYGLDTRFAGYPSSEERQQRGSIYEAYGGWSSPGGAFRVRAGQLWLYELGAFGSVAGAAAEVRLLKEEDHSVGTLKAGLFGGLEPKVLSLGYVDGVSKLGGYLSLESKSGRRHVLGYANIRNQSLTERSVIFFSNYIPVRNSFFLYQAAEYDLQGPGGQGKSQLTYFFTNVRYAPVREVEIQGVYHRGISVDTRFIADSLREGRPVTEAQLEGFLFESISGRLTLRPWRNFQFFVGYAEDRTRQEEETRHRLSFGIFSPNLLRSGFDVTVSDTRFKTAAGSTSDAWYFSLGRDVGRSLYFEAYYRTSIAFLRLTSSGVLVDRRPYSHLYGLSSVIRIGRRVSILALLERTDEDSLGETRVLSGLSYRF
jgi:hypothetical protein